MGNESTQRGTLDAGQVLAAAEQLVDDLGWDALTMTSLAGALGVRTPSLYKHVEGLADVRRRLGLVGVQHMAEVLRTAVLGRSGGDALQAMADAFRRWVRAHPGRYAAQSYLALQDDVDYWKAADRATEAVLAVLRSYGVEGGAARQALVVLWSAVHGFLNLEAAGALEGYVDVDATFAELVATFARGLTEKGRRRRQA